MSKGTLTIRGDARTNAIQIDGLAAGAFEIRGLSGTTINGGSAAFRATDITGRIKIDLDTGSDTLILNAPVTRGRLSIVGDSGDTVLVGPRVAASRAVNSSSDGDVIAVIDALLDSGLEVRTGNGTDRVALCDVAVDGPVRTNTGGGSDTVQQDNVSAHDTLAVRTGGGNDTVMIEQTPDSAGTPSVFEGKTRLRTRRGNDRLLIGSTGSSTNSARFGNRARVRGGRGYDVFDAALSTSPNSRGNQFALPPQIQGVETAT